MAMQLLPPLMIRLFNDEWKGRNYRIALVLAGKAKPTFVKMIRLRIMDASKMSEKLLWGSVKLGRTSVFPDRIKHMYMKM